MVNIEINGNQVEAEEGSMLIEAADAAGIAIPRFCYHKKLSVAASCRMCLVEVEKAPKPIPACATPVTEGMVVRTRSPRALAAQNAVMEFLLINHPLDCPICDQGGDCDLQEVAMGYGQVGSSYGEEKRVVASKNLGPLIATDMSRCIHCTRCVRFGQEIAGIMELGATGRGEHMKIGTYVERTVDSELSGNVIDLCPVGALTAKPSRYVGRPWEQGVSEGVSPHDALGANIDIHSKNGEVVRVTARENEAVNESWIADRDRFSYQALGHEQRLTQPMIKKDGNWSETDWDTALTFAAEGLKGIAEVKLGALASASSSVEELYLLQKLMRGLGSDNIDHRLRQLDFSAQADAPAFPSLGMSLEALAELDAALIVGANIRKEQPLIAHRLRKAALGGARMMFVNPADYDLRFPVAEKLIVKPAAMVAQLAGIAKALLDITGEAAPEGLAGLLEDFTTHDAQVAIAKHLNAAESPALLLGAIAAGHPRQGDIRALAGLIARLSGARFGVLAEGGNAAGAWLAGAVPHRAEAAREVTKPGKHWRDMFEDGMSAYLLLNVEPELDCIDSGAALKAMHDAGFVVAMSAFKGDALSAYADVLLPIALFPESSGTFVNAEGRWQSTAAAVAAPGEAKPAWRVLRVLGNLLDVPGFGYMSSEEVLKEVHGAARELGHGEAPAWRCPEKLGGDDALERLGEFPIYSVDAMVRRAAALQATADAAVGMIRANAATLAKNGLSDAASARVAQGEASLVLPLVCDETLADGVVALPCGRNETVGLGAGFGPLELGQA